MSANALSADNTQVRGASSIPKGLRPPAQGCEQRATLGNHAESVPTLKGFCQLFDPAYSKTAPQPFQGCRCLAWSPRVARSSQPWALLRNPFGIHSFSRRRLDLLDEI